MNALPQPNTIVFCRFLRALGCMTLLLMGGITALGQGTIAAGNSGLTRFRVDQDSDGIADRIATSADGLTIAFFYGPAGSDPDQLLLVTTIGNTPGILANTPSVFAVPGTDPNQVISLRVRGWNSAFGMDWQAASNSFIGAFAQTKIAQITLGMAAGPGAVIWQTSDTSPSRFSPLVFPMSTKPRVSLGMEGAGVVTKFPDEETYETGTVVEVTASPSRWHVFSKWSDNETANPRMIIVTSNIQLIAIFTPTTPLETLQFGSVTRLAPVGMPAALADGVYVRDSNAIGRGSVTISLQTTFPNGRMFFTLDGSHPEVSSMLYQTAFEVKRSSLLRVVAFNADFSQSIEFDAVAIHVLPTLNASTKGGGVVSINPPAGAYFSNSYAVVSASAHPGWQFLHWLGDDGKTQPTANISMTRNRCVEAVFGSSLTVGATGNGDVFRSASPTFYPYGAIAKLAAIPHPGSYFVLWANDGFGTNNPLNFSVTKTNQTITAVFASLPENQEALTIVSVGEGEVSRNLRSNRLLSGTNVTITAIPSLGQDFIGWSGDLTGAQNPTTLSMTNSKVIMATFTRRPVLRVQPCMEGMTDDGFRVRLTSDYGLVYQIESSSNLIQWQPVFSITNEFGVVDFIDTAATNNSPQFYRAVTE